MYELGQFEDLLQAVPLQAQPPATVAIFFSVVSDVWKDLDHTTLGEAKKALYLAVKKRTTAGGVDVVVEEDLTDDTAGIMAGYRTLYLVDTHISIAATAAIADWVRAGGVVFATAGAGAFDEFNRPNTRMAELLGVKRGKITPSKQPVELSRRDLPYATPLDTVLLHTEALAGDSLPSYGVVEAGVAPAAGTEVLASFATSNTSALTLHNVGRGAAFACSFLPSFAFLHPALPAKPLDTCPRIDCYSQFFPFAFDMVAHSLIHLPDTMRGGRLPSLTVAQAKQAAGHAASSDALVEAVVLTPGGGDAGALVLLVNWQMEPATNLTITIQSVAAGGFKTAVLASSDEAVPFTASGAAVRLRVPAVAYADAVMLRP